MIIKFQNTYAELPKNFYEIVSPMPVKNPKLVHFNHTLAAELNIKAYNQDNDELAQIFSGNKLLIGSNPIAQYYAGHQYGYFVPQLGDGRAILLGEVTDISGHQRDIQLKGSGPTPFSRSGDGRAALGPMIREYIVSEAMHALGINTTRALAIVSSGESVQRQTIVPGAILTRIASSHVRIGTFEYFAAKHDEKSIKLLADFVIERHYPEIANTPNPYLALLLSVAENQGQLIISWMRVGFVHGVMNTDNMTISGETIDYGPCAFLDEYKAGKIFSSIDKHGRYGLSNQLNICFWNLLQFGKSIACLINSNHSEAMNAINHFLNEYYLTCKSDYFKMMLRKIGIDDPINKDIELIEDLLNIMEKDEADYTLTFRYLCYVFGDLNWPFHKQYFPTENISAWIIKWQHRLLMNSKSKFETIKRMFKLNPAVIPRNHIIEKIINYTTDSGDVSQIDLCMRILQDPYNDKQDNIIRYLRAPTPSERVHHTYCGT